MSPSEKGVVDANALAAARGDTASRLDQSEDVMRAFALAVLDEINLHAARITAILDAIDGANNLSSLKSGIGAIDDVPQRSIAQLKSALRGKLGA